MSLMKNREYWRSLDQLDETPEFKRFYESEFPEAMQDAGDHVSRRKFLGLMGASMALAGLAGCRRPVEKIVPYIAPPEDMVPGVPVEYNTTMPFGNGAYGLTVRTYEGRPVKLEGNPKHSSTLGSSNVFIQGEILNLYDPDRSKSVLHKGAERTWVDFVVAWRELYTTYRAEKGKGIAVISPSFSSPTLVRLAQDFQLNFPQGRWVVYDPVSDENIYKGIKAATGRELIPNYKFASAKVILALDSDFMHLDSENITAARGFADGRRVENTHNEMNRLYVVEGALTLTGSMADHRLRVKNSEIGAFAVALAGELQLLGLNIPGMSDTPASADFNQKWISAVAKDLMQHRGKSLVIAGRGQSIAVQALVLAINSALGNLGQTIEFRDADADFLPDANELALLKEDINNKNISTLIILGSNPVYETPYDLNFNTIKQVIHLADRVNETSEQATWHIPQAHFLESWGDAKAVDGLVSPIQPMIEPLHGGKSDVEVLNLIATGEDARGYDIVRKTWETILPRTTFEKAWRKALHDGLIENSSKTVVPALQPSGVQTALQYYPIEDRSTKTQFEIVLKPSSHVYDGRYNNNGWLLENPDPITKLTWDNAALMSPSTARELLVEKNDLVAVTVKKNTVKLPVWIVPGMADFVIAIPLGFGRLVSGRVGDGIGGNAYKLRTHFNSFVETDVTVTKTRGSYELVSSQDHGSMEGRPLVREGSLDEYVENPFFAKEMVEHPPLKSLWKEHTYEEGYQWGMAIDLNTCIGCGACTISCQSENNISVVGKEQVGKGREMHWIRVDRYFEGDTDDPELVHQPVGCQHCEMAPCEGVCPVAATVHDSEGLNLMVYNRCVGTRYCSNNCPYKVRRFNFFNYIKDYPETIKMAQNPNVTVRSRGVMEKCTYCLQRINEAKLKAKREGREIRDGEFKTACQQACPTQAIKFGNILDPDSEVAKAKAGNRDYAMLGEYNLKPRTSYLAKLRNPNPELA